jgi:hypothetical protein
MFKWQIWYTEMTNLWQFTTDVLKSHPRPQCTLQLVCNDYVLCVGVDLDISLCRQQHRKCERASCLMYPPVFYKLCSSSNPTNKNLSELGLEIQAAVSQ